jgi:predicted 3-demethylubiquinone-9 3-methyltransferase (glyoxalase superfamily)
VKPLYAFLLMHDRAREAADFYASVFPDGEVLEVLRHGPGSWGPEGEVMSATVLIAGMTVVLLNGGPAASFTPATSLVVETDDQAETDRYWAALTDGGEPSQCGWLRDRFGVHWQVTPTRMLELLRDPDPARAGRAMQAMMRMTKLEISELEAAAAG